MVGRCLPTHGVAWWATCVLDKLPPTLQGWARCSLAQTRRGLTDATGLKEVALPRAGRLLGHLTADPSLLPEFLRVS